MLFIAPDFQHFQAQVRAWWIETRDEKTEREFLAGLGCKSPKVIKQTSRERYRSLAARADTEGDKTAAEGHANAN